MTHNRIRYAVFLAPALAILAAFFALGVGHSSHTAQAVNPVVIGLDMQTAATNPATYTTLPTFEKCVDVKTTVNSGVFYFDVFVENASGLFAYQGDAGWLQFTPGKMQIQNATVKEFFGTGTTVNNYSRNVSDPASDVVSPAVSDGSYHIVALDTGSTHTGSGVLARIKAQAFIFGGGSVINVSLTQTSAVGMTLTADPGATHPGDTTGDGKFDGTIINKTATIAVDQPDGDGDGVSNTCDNCPTTPNGPAQANVANVGNQTDIDGDGIGDACDPDRDGDGIPNASDNCPNTYNPTQDPSVCLDSDGDGIINANDNCPNTFNPDQADFDRDGIGDVCDPDDDNDGIPDVSDNCQFVVNPSQADWNKDGIGDACQDSDGDLILDAVDNCKGIANNNQADGDADGVGDLCDNCPTTSNFDQLDTDGDHIGNACDPDDDNDTFSDVMETYVGTNTLQRCAATTTRNDEAVDATPLDNDDNRLVSGQDILAYGPVWNSIGPNPPYKKRLDVNMDGRIGGQDILKFGPYFNKPACTYP